jgi:hypothetical protein
VAYKRASDYCDGSNCDWLGLHIDWHIVGLIAISSDCISIDIDGRFDDGFDGGSFDWFHLAMLGYQPQRSIWQFSQEAFMAISWEGFMGYQQRGFYRLL